MALTRRELLKIIGIKGAAGLLSHALTGELFFGATASLSEDMYPRGDILVCIFQRGGMDGLNAVIPCGDPNYYHLRYSLRIPEPKAGVEKAAIDLDGFFGLHPSLFPLKEIWDEQDLAIVHAAGLPFSTHSHFDAMDFMEQGSSGDKNLQSGWLARHLQTIDTQNRSPLRAVSIGTMVPESLNGPVSVVALSALGEFRLGGRYDIPQVTEFKDALAALFRFGSSLDAVSAVALQAIEIVDRVAGDGRPSATSVEYPQSNFGQSMSTLAQLIKAEVGLEIATVDIGGWDTHINQGAIEGQMPRLLSDLSKSLNAFYRDMGVGMEHITIVTMSDFGRRAAENSGGGTDHGHGNVMFVIGRNIYGGKVYGQWPGLAREDLAGPGDLAVTTDFRMVLAEIVQKRLKNDNLVEVFPAFTQQPEFLGLAK